MKKCTKLAVLAAALTALFSLTAFAAKGWTVEDGVWYYYDNDGDKVSDCWKAYGGKMYWLGDDYAMVTNSLVDDDNYYVGEDGAKVTSAWVKVAADEDDETGAEYRYYYAQSSGKLFKATDEAWMKKINGKYYAFDSDGLMLFGFVKDKAMINDEEDAVLDCEYYFGTEDDGARVSGWYHYEDGLTTLDASDAWFYFDSGKKVTGNGYKLISKKYYAFDEYGIMQTGWYASESDGDYKYFNEDGSLKKSGWVYTDKDEDGYSVTDEGWFYIGSDGRAIEGATKKISSKWYVFNAKGVMKAGLVELNPASSGETTVSSNGGFKTSGLTDYTADTIRSTYSTNLFYFSGDSTNDGAAKSGTLTIDLADATYTMAFNKYTYKALHGYDSSSKLVYDHGILRAAGSTKYDVKNVYTDNEAGTIDYYFVDTNGKNILTTGKYMDSSDNYYIVNANVATTETITGSGKYNDDHETCKVEFYVACNDYEYYNTSGDSKWTSASTVASDILSVVKGNKTETWFNDKYVKDLADFIYSGQ